ncbi:tryptophan synthase subunit alpha [Candidatus Bathyarchaeota archaeon]|nr:tryptophan synthase subunit alpha [Candidatus Bathyarchaeota archaeon]
MRRLAKVFSSLRARGEGGLIAYVTAGDPDPSLTPEIVGALIDGGADVIELGIPFSDPIADGSAIQAAVARALKAGMTPRKIFTMIEKVREGSETPIVVLTYYNPLFRMGVKCFFESMQACGADGVIVPDLPPEEAYEYKRIAEDYEIDTIFLAAPSTSTERLKRILGYTSGFLYLVSVFGVTGARAEVRDLTVNLIKGTLKTIQGKVPLAVGFGISKPEHVAKVLESGADAAIVGSALVKIVEEKRREIEDLIETLRIYTRSLKNSTKPLKLNSSRR